MKRSKALVLTTTQSGTSLVILKQTSPFITLRSRTHRQVQEQIAQV